MPIELNGTEYEIWLMQDGEPVPFDTVLGDDTAIHEHLHIDHDIQTVSGNSSASGTLTWQTETGDAGTYDIVVQSPDDSATVEVTVNTPMAGEFIDNFANGSFDSGWGDTSAASITSAAGADNGYAAYRTGASQNYPFMTATEGSLPGDFEAGGDYVEVRTNAEDTDGGLIFNANGGEWYIFYVPYGSFGEAQIWGYSDSGWGSEHLNLNTGQHSGWIRQVAQVQSDGTAFHGIYDDDGNEIGAGTTSSGALDTDGNSWGLFSYAESTDRKFDWIKTHSSNPHA